MQSIQDRPDAPLSKGKKTMGRILPISLTGILLIVIIVILLT
ncbi:hypothetical protein [Nesterenkonia jeotgali]|nr:hypothetical protein [Nesterenkonia jeotgali]